MRAAKPPPSGCTRIGTVDIPDAELKALTATALVERLTTGGMSRLSAERVVEIVRGLADQGRARNHVQFRR